MIATQFEVTLPTELYAVTQILNLLPGVQADVSMLYVFKKGLFEIEATSTGRNKLSLLSASS